MPSAYDPGALGPAKHISSGWDEHTKKSMKEGAERLRIEAAARRVAVALGYDSGEWRSFELHAKAALATE